MRPLYGLLVLFALSAVAQSAERGPWSAVRPDAIRGHVEFLANDLLEGRASATRGYDISAAYVSSQFRLAGLMPGGDDDAYLQRIPLLEATAVLPGSSAELVVEDETRTFEYGTDYLPSADYMSASSTLTAPLVFAGYGVSAPELDYDDFRDLDLKGRIAVVFSGAPAKFPSDLRAYHSWNQRKFGVLIERGAVGMITIDSPVDAKRDPWERRVGMSWTPQMRWLDERGQPRDAFPELKLRFRFNQEAGARLFEHAQTAWDSVLAAADAGTPQGFELPGMMTLSATTGLRRTESSNVVGVLPGSDPQLKNEYVVLTAHLDHLGRGAAVNGDSIYNGAHDNAVGVAMLLEIARALHIAGTKPRRSIIFAAVTAEEKGLLGADFFAERAQGKDLKIVANVNMDMPLTFVPLQEFVALGAEHSSLGATARAAAAAQGYRLGGDELPEEVRFIRSDQFAFIRRGVPAIVLIGGDKPRDASVDLEALRRDYRQSHYHQPSDDLSLPMDDGTTADLARVNLRILLDAANAQNPPRWLPGDFFGEKFGAGR